MAMLYFQGIRILPKGSEIFRWDFPWNKDGKDQSVRPTLEILQAPYIIEGYNPALKQSTMLGWNFGEDTPNAFKYQSSILKDLEGRYHWFTRMEDGSIVKGKPLTDEEVQQMGEYQYRIIDGPDVFVFMAQADDEQLTPEATAPTPKKPYERWFDALNEQITAWFYKEQSLGARITAFIESQNALAKQHPDLATPVVEEATPQTIMLGGIGLKLPEGNSDS